MVRTIVQLTEEQAVMLREQAKSQHVSVSELVRQGVDLVLRSGITNENARQRARAAVGFVSDAPNLSVDHDKMLMDVYTGETTQ